VSSGSGFFTGLLLGAAAGAAVGMLCSPRSGQENRDLLMERFPELRERAPELLNRAREEARTRLDAGREAYVETAEATRTHMTQELDERQGEATGAA